MLLYLCPDTAKARARMVSSTAKGPFASHVSRAGIEIIGQVEARDVDDIETALRRAQGGGDDEAAGGASAEGGGESQESMLSARPKGPGRRRRK